MRTVEVLPDGEHAGFAWRSLRKFHNIPSCTAALVERRGVPKKYERNVRKQMEQLRYSLVQAKEYFDAADAVSSATKPLQLYYCCMCLALAEILWKGDGNHSLDKLRGTHRHHGLVIGFPSRTDTCFATFSSQLVAKPMTVMGSRFGTFEVWHRFARQLPLIGQQTIRGEAAGTELSTAVMFTPSDEPFDPLPPTGVSLLECLLRLPGMAQPLKTFGLSSALLRTHLNRSLTMKGQTVATAAYSIDVQPADATRLENLRHRLLFNPNAVDQVDSFDYSSGFNVTWKFNLENGHYGCEFPEGFSYTKKDMFFLTEIDYLNEFGFIYISLYIMGMFSRYYPDLWMREIEANTDFSIIIEHFLEYARWRLPVLVLGELSDKVFVLND